MLVWAAIASAVFAYFLVDAQKNKAEAIAKAEARALDKAAIAAEHADHLFEATNIAMLAIQHIAGATRDWRELSEERASWELIRQWAGALSFLPRFVLVDEVGVTRVHTDIFPAPPQTIADRPYFSAHREQPGLGMIISAPVTGRVTGLTIMPLSMRLNRPDGAFRGVLVAIVEPKVFENYYKSMEIEGRGHITLLRNDGLVLVRYPQAAGAVGKVIDNRKAFPAIAAGDKFGVAHTVSPVDGIERITAFHRAQKLGFIAIVGLDKPQILAEWRDSAARSGAILGSALLSITLMLVILILRHAKILATQNALQVSEANLHRAQSVAHIGSWYFDIPGKSLVWTDETYRLFGLPPGAPISGSIILERVHPEDRDRVRQAWKNALNGHVYDIDHRVVAEGKIRWVHAQAEIVADERGRPVSAVGTAQDITLRKEAELAIEEKNRDLERSNAELEAFAYVSAHDLREPLRNVNSFALLLERRLDSRLEGEERDFFKIVRDGALRMDHLVSDLLDYSRIGKLQMETSPVQMQVAFDEAKANLAAQIADSQAEVILPADLPIVIGSHGEIMRLLQNLIANALKYRQRNVAPRIKVDCGRKGGDWWFSIADNGIGIAPDQFERIFRIFQRLHGREDFGGGTGIGLAVCKKIVERHGGRIWVTSEGEGKGSTFFFTLPSA